jgi:hypothetical protein
MLGRDDHGFVDISAMALNAAIKRSIFALPDARLVMMMALPFGFTCALATAKPLFPRGRLADAGDSRVPPVARGILDVPARQYSNR